MQNEGSLNLMSSFEFISILMSIVIGLGVTNLLAAGRAFYGRRETPMDEVHIVLTLATLLILSLNWCVPFKRNTECRVEFRQISRAHCVNDHALSVDDVPLSAGFVGGRGTSEPVRRKSKQLLRRVYRVLLNGHHPNGFAQRIVRPSLVSAVCRSLRSSRRSRINCAQMRIRLLLCVVPTDHPFGLGIRGPAIFGQRFDRRLITG